MLSVPRGSEESEQYTKMQKHTFEKKLEKGNPLSLANAQVSLLVLASIQRPAHISMTMIRHSSTTAAALDCVAW